MVADTYSTDGVGVLLMGTGNDNNSWGDNANTSVFQIIMDALANVLTSAVTGGTLTLSGSPPPAAASQTRYAALKFTGILASNQVVQVPNLNKWWLVCNATSGAFTLKFKTASGSASTAIPQNSGWQMVRCTGADVIEVWPFNTAQIQMPDGTVGAPAYSNLTEPTAGWYRHGTQDWRLSINGVGVLQVTGTGAAIPSIINALSPNVFQQAGIQIVPAGTEVAYAGITAPTGWYLEYGQAVTRATDTALLAAITITCTGDTHTNTTLDNLSVDLRNIGLEGALIEGTGIALGTTIVSVNSATALTLSGAASGSSAVIAIRVLPYGQGDGSTTFNIPDRRGRVIAGRDNMGGSAASRLTSTYFGTSASKLNAVGGAESKIIVTVNLPAYTPTGAVNVTDPGHTHTVTLKNDAAGGGGGWVAGLSSPTQILTSSSNVSGITCAFVGVAQGGTSTPVAIVQPTGIANMMIKR